MNNDEFDKVLRDSNAASSIQAPADFDRRAAPGTTESFNENIFRAAQQQYRAPGPREAQNIAEMFFAGGQRSATGLLLRGELPTLTVPDSAAWYERAIANLGELGADLPLGIGGAVVGGIAGSVVPGPGSIIGAGAGGFGVPMALRESLMQAYSQNAAGDPRDWWEVVKSGVKGFAVGGVIGGATMGAGRAAAVMTKGMSPLAQLGIGTASEYSALMTTTAAVHQQLPTAQDFLDTAILLGGLKGAVAIGQRLRASYAETGRTPAEIAEEALRNPELMKALRGEKEFDGPIPKELQALAIEERVKRIREADPSGEILGQVVHDLATGVDNPQAVLARLGEAINPEYIVDADTAKAIIKVIETIYDDKVQKVTRGVVPQEKSIKEGIWHSARGMDEHIIGQAENAGQLAGRMIVLKAMLNRAERVAQELKDIAPENLTLEHKLQLAAAAEGVQMAYLDFRGARAEAGRALNIMRRLKYDRGALADAEAYINIFEKGYEGGQWNQMVAMMNALKGNAMGLARLLRERGQATTTQKLLELWKAAILSGPWTQSANFMGNLIKVVADLPVKTMEVGIEQVRRAVTGKDLMTVDQVSAKVFSVGHGFIRGAADGLKLAWEAIKGDENVGMEKLDHYQHAISGTKGHIIRTPFRVLQGVDALFRTIFERGRAHELAVDRALAEKYIPGTKEYLEAVHRYTNDPTIGMNKTQAAAVQRDIYNAGSESVFAQRLGTKMEKLQSVFHGSALGMIAPFIRTPTNLLSWAVQHTPLAPVLSGRWRADFMAGGQRRSQAISRMATGSMMFALATHYVNTGQITGGGMFDKEMGETKRAAGWQPYSIKIGDTYYSYARMEPVAKVIGIAADIAEMWDKVNDDDKASMTLAAVAMLGNLTISSTYLSGLAGAMNALSDPQRYGQQFLEQYAATLVPRLVGQIAAMDDPYKREVDGIADAVIAQLPYFREKLMPKRDVWGEKVLNEKALYGLVPVQVSKESTLTVAKEAEKLGIALTRIPDYIIQPGPLPSKERKINLTDQQFDLAKEVTGKAALGILTPLVESPGWKEIPMFAKEMIFKRVVALTKRGARYAVLPADAEERLAISRQISEEVIKQALEVNPE